MRLPDVIILVLVERVVEFYEGKTEDIINALLEDNLHPEIAALDRNMLSKAELEQSKIIMYLKITVLTLIIIEKKKSIIPGLYHKKAKPIAEDEMGRRKDQIFVNAIAKQYAYVTEEVEVKVAEDGATEQVEDVEQEITDEFGARFKMNGKIRYHIKWGASSRWSFGSNLAWCCVETTIGETHATLTYIGLL